MVAAPASARSNYADELLRALASGRADPSSIYQRLRRLGPVVRSHWGVLVVDYNHCLKVVSDPDRFGQLTAQVYDRTVPGWSSHLTLRTATATPVMNDPPQHGRLRPPLTASLTTHRTRPLQGRLRQRVDQLINNLAATIKATGEADLMTDLARPLAVTVAGLLLKIPEDQLTHLAPEAPAISDGIAEMLRTEQALVPADAGIARVLNILTATTTQRGPECAGDVTSALLHHTTDGQPLSEPEILADLVAILLPTLNNVPALVGNIVATLDGYPAQRTQLAHESALTSQAIQELIRICSPIQVIFRAPKIASELGGCPISRRDTLFVMIGAATRDSSRWPSPDTLRLDRPARQQDAKLRSFGYGTHRCVGEPITRLTLQTLLPRLYSRLPDLYVSRQPERRPGITVADHTRLLVSRERRP